MVVSAAGSPENAFGARVLIAMEWTDWKVASVAQELGAAVLLPPPLWETQGGKQTIAQSFLGAFGVKMRGQHATCGVPFIGPL